jgi:hypothetical protein
MRLSAGSGEDRHDLADVLPTLGDHHAKLCH